MWKPSAGRHSFLRLADAAERWLDKPIIGTHAAPLWSGPREMGSGFARWGGAGRRTVGGRRRHGHGGRGGCTTDGIRSLEEQWDKSWAVDVPAGGLVCQEFLPHFLANSGGTIANVASVGGLIGIPNRAAYCASKLLRISTDFFFSARDCIN